MNRTRCNTTHGHTRQIGGRGGKVTKSPTYHSFAAMHDRCYNPRHKWYPAYGGRGIEVCPEWRRGRDNPDAFANFLRDVGERPSKEMTLDRVDVNGNYQKLRADGSPQCRWADKSTQRTNQRPAAEIRAVISAEDAELIRTVCHEVPY